LLAISRFTTAAPLSDDVVQDLVRHRLAERFRLDSGR